MPANRCAAGIAERRIAAQREGRRLMGQLKPGMWLAAQDRENRDVFWIGQAVQVKKPKGREKEHECCQ